MIHQIFFFLFINTYITLCSDEFIVLMGGFFYTCVLQYMCVHVFCFGFDANANAIFARSLSRRVGFACVVPVFRDCDQKA